MATPKRFIAGAVCPRCGAMDRLTMYQDDEGMFRECIECGFEDSQSHEGMDAPELETRVNHKDNEADHTVKQVVFFKSGGDGEG